MTSWMHRRWLGLWARLHRDFDSTDPVAKRSARVTWSLLTAVACVVLGRTVTWASQAVGASTATTGWLGVWVLLVVFTIALSAVAAGPGRTRRPVLIATGLVTVVILLTALSWQP
ncbi:hypothetical protein ABT354_32935 [Streptomyces sp. NPDC000594]|uniref:hypothetical protein n=1 Tax=Streptomyces sp. NPDC000594 TaxID=3154261 RepID=UPI00331EAF3E